MLKTKRALNAKNKFEVIDIWINTQIKGNRQEGSYMEKMQQPSHGITIM